MPRELNLVYEASTKTWRWNCLRCGIRLLASQTFLDYMQKSSLSEDAVDTVKQVICRGEGKGHSVGAVTIEHA
jgi:hypothetical protein